MSVDIRKLKAGALACIGQDKPASELAAEHRLHEIFVLAN